LFSDADVLGKEGGDFLNNFLSQVPGIDEAIVFMNLLKMA
jgi:hypothetical protein